MNLKINRNDLCPCGSGKKFKKCCLNNKIGSFQKNRSCVLFVLLFISLIIAVSIIYTIIKRTGSSYQAAPFMDSKQPQKLPLDNILLRKEDISKYDIATLDLIAAQGLPGAENLNISECLFILRDWADRVDSETLAYLPKFHKNPSDYNNSEAYFRMLVLITVLEKDLNIRYNPNLMSKPVLKELQTTEFFRDSKDLFLHGAINNRLGTCASLPVLTVSVGRLLGYPLKLVTAKAHLFVRWDDGKEKFNIESGGHGMKCYPDEYYRKWPFPISDKEIQNGFYLKSLTPTEEFAIFLETRGLCLLEHNKLVEALNAFNHVSYLVPNHPFIKHYIQSTAEREMRMSD